MANSGDDGTDKSFPVNFVPCMSPRACSSAVSTDSVASVPDSIQPEEEHRYVELSHPAQLLSGLRDLQNRTQFCDVIISVDGQEFPCHKVVLSAFSQYFRAMFGGGLAESQQRKVSLNGVEPAMVQTLIDYGYTSEVVITRQNVQSLLSAANLLEIIPVKEACCLYLEKNMDELNCVGIHCFAELHACSELQQKSKVYILHHFQSVWQHEEFLELTKVKLVEILSDDDLNIDNEEIVYHAAVRWLDHDVGNRRNGFESVLECVRLPLVSCYFIHDHVESHEVIKCSQACQKLVKEAKDFHLLQDRRAEFSSPRTKVRKSSDKTEVIVAVGGEDDKVVLRSVETYDPNTLSWKPLACLPFAISKHGIVSAGDSYLFLAGGEYPDGSANKSVMRYDPCLDVWTEVAPMNIARSELGLVMLDGFMYAIGGWDGNVRLDSVEYYNIETNVWTIIPPMKIALTSPACVSLNGMLYVTGGAVLEDGDGIDIVQLFNPRTQTWSEMRSMKIPRSGSGACVLDGKIYVIGGWHASTENTKRVECYDPKMNTWIERCPLHERRYRPGVAVVGGKIYACGGEEGWDRYHDTIECYDPITDSWEIIGEMQTSRSWLSCVSMVIRKDLIGKDRNTTHQCTV
ncbi:kelch-like protein 24 [Mytilus galloprovincialis]|uniref:kelch-like protein 24 n=1 Tax=Mytilus galloprovincialis TaxID=29158 RepID=UPI003F7C84B2